MDKATFCRALAAAPDAAAENRLVEEWMEARGPGDELAFTVRDRAGKPLGSGEFVAADYASLDVLLECGGEPVRWTPKSEAAFTFLFRE